MDAERSFVMTKTPHLLPKLDAISDYRTSPMLGQRQAEVLQELAKVGPVGASCGRIAKAIDYDEPNCHITFSALAVKGLVDKDASTYPHSYRLAPPLLDGIVSDGGGTPVAGRTENWRLIKEAAKALTAAGQSPFTCQTAYE
jgi:hypothetical protein